MDDLMRAAHGVRWLWCVLLLLLAACPPTVAPTPVCGNGIREASELCDGADLGGATCMSLGLSIGALNCKADCTLDATGCGGQGNCGPANCAGCCAARVCQAGATVGACGSSGSTCAACGAGQLCAGGKCAAPGCGNGVAEPQEACDGTDLKGASCSSLGLGTGQLVCNSDCTVNDTACSASPCARAEHDKTACDFCYQSAQYHCGFCRSPGTPDNVYKCPPRECYTVHDPAYPADYISLECRAPGETPCDAGTNVSHCDGNKEVLCSNGYTLTTDCTAASNGRTQCLSGASGVAQCVAPGTTVCPAGFVPSCTGSTRNYCDNGGYLIHQTCAGTCAQTMLGPWCVDVGTTACGSSQSEHCDSDTAVHCSLQLGWEVKESCAIDALGQPRGLTCAIRTRDHTAACVQPGATECGQGGLADGGSIGWTPCNGDRLQDCGDGFTIFSDCDAGTQCVASTDNRVRGLHVCLAPGYTPCNPSGFQGGCDADGGAVNCFNYLSREACSNPNPVCSVHWQFAICSYAGAQACSGPACVDSSTLTGCDVNTFTQIQVPCPTNCTCTQPKFGDSACFRTTIAGTLICN